MIWIILGIIVGQLHTRERRHVYTSEYPLFLPFCFTNEKKVLLKIAEGIAAHPTVSLCFEHNTDRED